MAKEHRPLVLFSLITFCFWAPSYFYLQVLPDYAKQLGGSLAIIGWIGGAYGLAQLILRFPVGMWSDAMGRRKPFITAGMLAALVSALMFLLARSVSALFWARTMAGVSATIWVILTVYVAGSFPAGEAPRAMGMLNAFSSLGQLVSSAFGYWAMLSFNTLVALDLGLRMGALGWLSFWNMAPTIAVSLCLGPIQGRWGQRRPLVVTFFLFALVTALMPLSRSPFQLCLIIGLAGLARGVAPAQRGTAMGFFQAAYALGMFAGPAISGFVANHAGLPAAFLLAGLIMAGGGIGSWAAIGRR